MKNWLSRRPAYWLLPALVAAALVVMPVARIDRSTAERIRPGMSLSDVERLVGASHGCHDGIVNYESTAPFHKHGWVPGRPWQQVAWVGTKGEILVSFDAGGKVTSAGFYEGHATERSFRYLLVERLGVRFVTPCDRCRFVTPCVGDYW